MSVFKTVEGPWWNDKPVILVGTGSSLKGFDFNRLKGLGYILAVKESFLDLPFADAVFGLDLGWMKRRRQLLERLTMPLYLAIPESGKFVHDPPFKNATYLKRVRIVNKLSEDPSYIESCGHTGFGALNLAYLKKPRQVFLFGFDYYGSHYCPERYNSWVTGGEHARYLKRWASTFGHAARQITQARIELLVASPLSNVPCFPKVEIDVAIQRLHRIRSERDGSVCRNTQQSFETSDAAP